MLDNIYIVIVYFSGGDVIDFEIKVSFLMKSFSQLKKKVRTKIQISYERK